MGADDILVCPGGVVQTHLDGYPVCTDGVGTPQAWVLQGRSNFWNPDLSTADVAELMGATLLVFAVAWGVRVCSNAISNRR